MGRLSFSGRSAPGLRSGMSYPVKTSCCQTMENAVRIAWLQPPVMADAGSRVSAMIAQLTKKGPESSMYHTPPFREDRIEIQHALIRAHPLGLLITAGPAGLLANLFPFLLDGGGEKG